MVKSRLKKVPQSARLSAGGGVNAIWAMPTWGWWQVERGFPKRNQQFRKWKTPKGPLTGLLVCSTFNTKMQTWNNVCCHFNCTRLFPFHNLYFWLFQFSSPRFASDQRDWPIFIRYFTKSGQSTILNWVGLSKLGKLLERLQKMLNILCLKTLPKHIIYILCIAVTCKNNGDRNNGGEEGEGGEYEARDASEARVVIVSTQ